VVSGPVVHRGRRSWSAAVPSHRDRTARRYAGHQPTTTGQPVRAAPPHGDKTARLSRAGSSERDGTAVRATVGRAGPRGGRRGRPNAARLGGRAALTGVGRHGPSSAHAGSTSRRGKIGSRALARRSSMESRCPLWTKTIWSTVDSADRRRAAPRGGTAPIVAASNRRLTTWPTGQRPALRPEFRTAVPGDERHTTLRRRRPPTPCLRPSAPAWPAPSGPARSSPPASGWPADPAGSRSPRPC
jgi:hypothetical protein